MVMPLAMHLMMRHYRHSSSSGGKIGMSSSISSISSSSSSSYRAHHLASLSKRARSSAFGSFVWAKSISHRSSNGGAFKLMVLPLELQPLASMGGCQRACRTRRRRQRWTGGMFRQQQQQL